MALAFETSKPIPSDTPSPARLHLLIFPNMSTSWGPSIQIYEPVGTIFIQTTTGFMSHEASSLSTEESVPVWEKGGPLADWPERSKSCWVRTSWYFGIVLTRR